MTLSESSERDMDKEYGVREDEVSLQEGIRIIEEGGKGQGIEATRLFCKGEIVVRGYALSQSTNRTQTSVQLDWKLHGEPSLSYVKANHSCSPNTGIRNNELGLYDLVTLQEIKPGEAITWDYAMAEWEVGGVPGSCLCGSENCRGRISGASEVPVSKLYGDLIADYLKKINNRPLP